MTAADKKPELLFEMKEKIGFKSFYQDNIKFTPDGKYLLAILNNEAGFRQPVRFDLKTKEKKRLIKGNFESYPIIGFSMVFIRDISEIAFFCPRIPSIMELKPM